MTSSSLLRTLRLTAGLTGVAVIGSTARAQVQEGDLLIVFGASGNASSLVEYDPDGNVANTIGALDFRSFTAAALTPDGDLVINKDNGYGMEVRAYDGTLIREFLTPLTYGSGWDVDVFDDGAVAICSKSHGVAIYDQMGTWLGSFEEPGMESVFGCYHASDDTLWVTDTLQSMPDAGHIYQFDRAGNVVNEFGVACDPSDIVQAPDGTLWMSDQGAGRIVQYSSAGVELISFDAQIDSTLKTLWSLAMNPQGELVAIGHYDSTVRTYGQSGVVLDEFDVTATGNPLFIFIPGEGGVGTPYCFGDGTGAFCPCANFAGPGEGCANSTGAGAVLAAFGNASVTFDQLQFMTTNLPVGQPALLFTGVNTPGGGDGIPFGDGLRCAGMNVTRLGVQTADGAGSASWGPGLGAQGGWVGGDTRYFQAWYRDPNNGPCGIGFNLSNGVEVVFYD